MNPYNVLLKPVLSEKSNESRVAESKYTFLINKKASKYDVFNAVDKVFSVKPVHVNTLIQPGKHKRRGASFYRTPAVKKAVVTLAKGQKLKIFDDE